MAGENKMRLIMRRLAGACLAAALVAGMAAAAKQSPTPPRLAGEAPPPASALSLSLTRGGDVYVANQHVTKDAVAVALEDHDARLREVMSEQQHDRLR